MLFFVEWFVFVGGIGGDFEELLCLFVEGFFFREK